MPFSGRNRSSRACDLNITARICEFWSFNVKYKCPESCARKFEISPSTHVSPYSRSICVRTAATRSRTDHMRRSGGLKLNPSWSVEDTAVEFITLTFSSWLLAFNRDLQALEGKNITTKR